MIVIDIERLWGDMKMSDKSDKSPCGDMNMSEKPDKPDKPVISQPSPAGVAGRNLPTTTVISSLLTSNEGPTPDLQPTTAGSDSDTYS